MAAVEELKRGARVDEGTRPATQRGKVPEAGKEIDLGDPTSGFAQPGRLRQQGAAKFGEKAALDLGGTLLRGQDLGFELLELGRGKAFGVDEGLFALVVGRDGLEVGAGDLEVIAENGVEADLEGADPGAGALTFFNGGDALAAGGGKLAQLVEFGVDAGADGAGVAELRRGGFDERAGDPLFKIRQGIEGGELVPAYAGAEVGGGCPEAGQAA